MFYNKKPQQAPPAKKGGRPPKPNARTEKLSTRLSASEYLIVDAKIRQSGKDASAFIREMLLSDTVTEAPSAIGSVGSRSESQIRDCKIENRGSLRFWGEPSFFVLLSLPKSANWRKQSANSTLFLLS